MFHSAVGLPHDLPLCIIQLEHTASSEGVFSFRDPSWAMTACCCRNKRCGCYRAGTHRGSVRFCPLFTTDAATSTSHIAAPTGQIKRTSATFATSSFSFTICTILQTRPKTLYRRNPICHAPPSRFDSPRNSEKYRNRVLSPVPAESPVPAAFRKVSKRRLESSAC